MMYRYLGPLSSVTLSNVQPPVLQARRNGDGPPDTSTGSYILFPDAQLDLPENHPYVQTLLAQGRLIPVEMPRLKAAAKPAAKPADAPAKPAEAAQ
jgi:hypothetical protein